MKVKAVQIAQKLGISKATVSLALNNKPGVNEETKRKILECKRKMENGEIEKTEFYRKSNVIKVVMATKGMSISLNSEIDLWTDVMVTFEREAKKFGYEIGITYVDARRDSLEKLAKEYDQDDTAGIILQATELSPQEIAILENTEKPMIIYDNESVGARHHSVLADNYRGISKATEYLMNCGYKNIVYLENEKEIYNFTARRKAFCDALLQRNRNPYKEGSMVSAGTTIEDVYMKMMRYLAEKKLPDAFLMENYQVTIGTIRALQEMHIKIPEQIALVGVDMIPSYMTGNVEITSVKIPHIERAALAMMLLRQEMEEPSAIKSRILTDCQMKEGKSVENVRHPGKD